jgi:hypothetical protein
MMVFIGNRVRRRIQLHREPHDMTTLAALPTRNSSTMIIDVTEASRECPAEKPEQVPSEETVPTPLRSVPTHHHLEYEMPHTPTDNEPSDARTTAATDEFDRWFTSDEGTGSEPGSGWVTEVPAQGLNQMATKIQDLAQNLLAAMAHQRTLLDEVSRDAADTAASARVQVSRDAIAAVTDATGQYLEARAAADAVRLDLDKMLAVALEGACEIVAKAEESAASLIEHARSSVATIAADGETTHTLDLRENTASQREEGPARAAQQA